MFIFCGARTENQVDWISTSRSLYVSATGQLETPAHVPPADTLPIEKNRRSNGNETDKDLCSSTLMVTQARWGAEDLYEYILSAIAHSVQNLRLSKQPKPEQDL
jgi:hypothetical protein